jgi:hypothetical protein
MACVLQYTLLEIHIKWCFHHKVTVRIFCVCQSNLNIYQHKSQQHTLHKQFYYVATGFDTELGLSSGHDARMHEYECIAAYIHILYDIRMQEYERI